MSPGLETLGQRLRSIVPNAKSRVVQKMEDWKTVGIKVKEGRMNEIDLNKRRLLQVAGYGALTGVLASCTPKTVELITATPKKEDEKVHSGLLYKKDIAVIKIEDGLGLRATLAGLDYIPMTEDLSRLAFVGLKFGQGEPNGQVLVKDRISGVLPGLKEAMIAYDKNGIEKSGLLSMDDGLFVLTRMGEGDENSLTIFAPNYASIKRNLDGSAIMDAYMTTRDNQGKWRIGKNIKVPVTFVFDTDGKLISYTIPVLNPSFEPTREPEQRADVVVPKNISFVSKELKVEATKTPTPTQTPAPTATAQKNENIATPQPSRKELIYKNKVETFFTEPVSNPSIFVNYKGQKLGDLFEDKNPSNPGQMFYTKSVEVFRGSDGEIYSRSFVGENKIIITRINVIRYFNNSVGKSVEISPKDLNGLKIIEKEDGHTMVFLPKSKYLTLIDATNAIQQSVSNDEILNGELNFGSGILNQ